MNKKCLFILLDDDSMEYILNEFKKNMKNKFKKIKYIFWKKVLFPIILHYYRDKATVVHRFLLFIFCYNILHLKKDIALKRIFNPNYMVPLSLIKSRNYE